MNKQIKQYIGLIVQLGGIVASLYYLMLFSPVEASGELHVTNVLLGVLLIGFSLFIASRLLLLIFLSRRRSTLISGVLSFSIIQLLLLSSLDLISVGPLLSVIAFNAILVWYIDRRFKL